jgi:hypothetical protein
MVSGHWCGSRSELFIKAADADVQLVQPKTQHNWIAIGKIEGLVASNIAKWYQDAIVFDPTHYQFTAGKDRKLIWSVNDCVQLEDFLAPDLDLTVIQAGLDITAFEKRRLEEEESWRPARHPSTPLTKGEHLLESSGRML